MEFDNHCNIGFGIINCRAIALGRQFAATIRGVKTGVPSQVRCEPEIFSRVNCYVSKFGMITKIVAPRPAQQFSWRL